MTPCRKAALNALLDGFAHGVSGTLGATKSIESIDELGGFFVIDRPSSCEYIGRAGGREEFGEPDGIGARRGAGVAGIQGDQPGQLR